MPVALVATPEVITGPAGPFLLQPAPQVPLYQESVRTAPNPILYENISPSMTITVQATGGCPLPVLPELITSVSIFPGQATNSGTGCNITKLVDIADKPVPNLPDFLLPKFVEPYIQYGAIAGPPAPTMSLVAPLRGLYGEKYFYDSEYIYASYYRNTPTFDPVDGKAPISINKQNRLTSINLLKGKQRMPFDTIPKDISEITTDLFTGEAEPINIEKLEPLTIGQAITTGSDYIYSSVPEVSSWVKWRPSFIEVMTYYYHVVVTHTCPPFVTIFQGSMLVQNNWTPAANRLSYYIALQNGFLDDENP